MGLFQFTLARNCHKYGFTHVKIVFQVYRYLATLSDSVLWISEITIDLFVLGDSWFEFVSKLIESVNGSIAQIGTLKFDEKVWSFLSLFLLPHSFGF